MKFKGTMGTQFSGSLAGITASHNAGGAYLRQRAIPVQPNTTGQQAVKGHFADLAASWLEDLDETQRAAWETYAENTPLVNVLGETIHISGRQFFIGNNTFRLRAGLAVVEDGPVTFGLPELTLPSIAVSDAPQAALTFTNTDGWAGAAGGALVLQMSPEQNPTVNFWKGPFRFVGKVAGAGTPPTSPTNFASGFPSALTEDNAVFSRLRATTADGRLSIPVILRSIISAGG